MQKDLKIGMIAGSILMTAAILWLTTRQSLSVKSRMMHSYTAVPSLPAKGSSDADANAARQKSNLNSPPAEKIKMHIVRENETLSDISRIYYGASNRWPKIINANPKIKDANKIRPGTKLIIPE